MRLLASGVLSDSGAFSPGENTMTKLLTKEVAARKLNISLRKLDYMRERGEIQFVRLGRCVRFTEQQLEEAVARNEQRVSA